jgi:hypothetical protein
MTRLDQASRTFHRPNMMLDCGWRVASVSHSPSLSLDAKINMVLAMPTLGPFVGPFVSAFRFDAGARIQELSVVRWSILEQGNGLS